MPPSNQANWHRGERQTLTSVNYACFSRRVGDSMKVVAGETATPWQSVALLNGERVLARCDQDAAGSHARLLLPAIDRLFSDTGLLPAQLDGLVVSIGPGSFTGSVSYTHL